MVGGKKKTIVRQKADKINSLLNLIRTRLSETGWNCTQPMRLSETPVVRCRRREFRREFQFFSLKTRGFS